MKDIELDEDFRTEVKALNKEARHLIGHAIAEVQRCFGNPHIHSKKKKVTGTRQP